MNWFSKSWVSVLCAITVRKKNNISFHTTIACAFYWKPIGPEMYYKSITVQQKLVIYSYLLGIAT